MSKFTQRVGDMGRILTRTEVFVALLIIGVSVIGFSLGRLSAREKTRPVVTLENVFPETGGGGLLTDNITSGSASPVIGTQSGEVLGSRNGTKYHYPWCSGASTIKEENKVWFVTIADARKAGYTPAANCKGLE